MPDNRKPITVRLNPDTLRLIDRLVDHQRRGCPPGNYPPRRRRFTRSDMIRHAITTGLDTLTGAEPIKL